MKTIRTAPVLRGLYLFLFSAASIAAEPYRPASDDTVLIQLPDATVQTVPAVDQWPVERQMQQVRDWLSRSERQADRRSLALAEQTLERLQGKHPQAGILLALALQRRHAFDPALNTLRRERRTGNTDPNLYIQLASLLRLRGELEAARSACEPLQELGPDDLHALCQLPIAGLSGHLSQSHRQLARLSLQRDPALQLWRDSELATQMERLGQASQARRLWTKILALDNQDNYARGQLAWNLWRSGRYSAMLSLLPPDPPHLHLQLLRLMALRGNGQTGWKQAAQDMEQRLLRAQRIHAENHDRELAWLRLLLLDDGVGAVKAARRNWQTQRSPDDILLLKAVTVKTGDSALRELLERYLRSTSYQDERLQQGPRQQTVSL